MNEGEKKLIHPEELLKKGKITRTSTSIPSIENTEDKEEPKYSFDPAVNSGGTVKVTFESGGRFGNPKYLLMKDMHGLHLENIITAKEDRLLETLVACLNECVIEPKGFDVGDLTNDEFFELMLGMKLAFDSIELKHRWAHKCQDNVPEKERKLSESSIDLREVKTMSIEETDDELKSFAKARFDEYSEDQFKSYLISKYGKLITSTPEEEVKNIQVREPIIIPSIEGSYEYNFMRIKYLIEAHRLAAKEFDHKIRVETNKSYTGMSPEQMQAVREEKIEEINREKARKFLSYSQAFCLVAKNTPEGKITYNTIDEKVTARNTVPRSVSLNYMKAVQTIKYGIQHECDLLCDLCDKSERRELQRIITPFELIPVSDSPRDFTKRGLQQPTGFDFHF